jgi:spore germination protein
MQEAAIVTSSIMLGSGVLTLPRTVTEKTGTPDGWISVILSGMIAVLAGIMMAKLSQRFPGQTYFEFSQHLVGKWVGRLLNFPLVVYFIVLGGYEIRSMAEVNSLYLLPRTPTAITMVLFIWVGVYLVTGGLTPIARLSSLLLPITVLIFLMTLGLSLKVVDFNNLRPVMGFGVMPVIKGITQTVLSFSGFEVILFLTAFMEDHRQAVKSVIIGISVPTFFYIIIVAFAVATLGLEETARITRPTVTMIRSFEVTGVIFERFESFLLAVWMLQIFTTYVCYHYLASIGLSSIFGKEFKTWTYWISPLIYLFAALPSDINERYLIGYIMGYVLLAFIGIIIPVLWGITWPKGKKHG